MAKIKNGFYVPEPKDVHDMDGSAVFTPDPNVSGRRFEPDGTGGGKLFLRVRRLKPGFRKPVEEWIAIDKRPFLSGDGASK
jgi:hypothetical protein